MVTRSRRGVGVGYRKRCKGKLVRESIWVEQFRVFWEGQRAGSQKTEGRSRLFEIWETIIDLTPHFGGRRSLYRTFTTETQSTQRKVVFPGRENTAREKSHRLRRKLFSPSSTVAMKPPAYLIVPGGLRSFARSPSPLRGVGSPSRRPIGQKKKTASVPSVSPWLAKKSGYPNLVSTAC